VPDIKKLIDISIRGYNPKIDDTDENAEFILFPSPIEKVGTGSFVLEYGKEYSLTAKLKGFPDVHKTIKGTNEFGEITINFGVADPDMAGIGLISPIGGAAPSSITPTTTTRLNLTSNPTGARIIFDGELTLKFTPAVLDTTPGTHTIKLTKDGYEQFLSDVICEEKRVTNFYANMKKSAVPSDTPGQLIITSTPSNSRIWLDGEYMRNLTPETYELPPKKYQIKITRSKHDDYIAEVEVVPGETTKHHADLTKAGQTTPPASPVAGAIISPEPSRGKLVLSSSPSNSRIWINGENMRNLTPETYDLPPGTYEVKITRSKYDAAIKTYNIVASETVYDHLNLFKAGQTPKGELPEAEARRLFIQLMDQLGLTSEDVVKLLEA